MSSGMNGGSAGGWVTERGTMVPRWTPNHEPDTEVRLDGRSLGFRVKDMLPDRRWAVDENGNVLSRHEFNERFKAWWQASCKKEDPFVPIPDREGFVAGCYDQEGKASRIGFDPGDPSKVVRAEKYTADGEVAVAAARETARIAEERGALKVLSALLKAGKLTPEEYTARVFEITEGESFQAAQAPREDPVAAEPAPAAEPVEIPEAVRASLPVMRRRVLDRFGLDGELDDERVAAFSKDTGVSPATVKAYARMARKAVREAL